MSKNLKISTIMVLFITACGGGGGGSSNGGDYNSNNSPIIDGSTTSYSVLENQTSAFTVQASDADGDTLSYSISSGDDASLFNISSSGVVTFVSAPDFEIAGDNNGDNSYQITATVSDGTASDSENFTIIVTNDTSDDATTSGYDGVIINGSYVQGATVCIEEVMGDGCSSASVTTTSTVDGSFSFEVDSAITGPLISEGGFNPNNNIAFDSELRNLKYFGELTTDQNMVVSKLTNIMDVYSDFTYESLKTSLGIDENFMIRFDDPYLNLSDANNNQVALINNQLLVLQHAFNKIDPAEADDTSIDLVEYKLADAIATRSGSEKSLADTTFIRDMMLNWNFDNFTLTNEILENLSAGLSSFIQKIYVNTSDNAHDHLSYVGLTYLDTSLSEIINGTASSAEIDTLIFDTLTYIDSNADTWSGGSFVDNEAYLNETTYSVSNSGSSYYTVDGTNASSTPLVIYATIGQVIKFEAAASSVFASHPFEISTQKDDTAGNNNIGTNEGWDQSTNTLTVNANTPTTLFPHCGVHSGMYTNGKIEIVTAFNQVSIDINQASGPLEVKGTVSSGPYKGASGYTHKVYLRTSDAGDSQHAHEFKEYPGITFYMPAGQGYHGQSSTSGEISFKTKSHY
ncbi:cadherin repeat domain-containing protein [Gammaproteobacteria bacterium]|nr:cadherin repeat domain-containing protein [Gammaproteobacteria bacterium]